MVGYFDPNWLSIFTFHQKQQDTGKIPSHATVVGAQEYDYDMSLWHNDYGVNLPFIWACRHLSGAARAYIPLSILRLPYSSYLAT